MDRSQVSRLGRKLISLVFLLFLALFFGVSAQPAHAQEATQSEISEKNPPETSEDTEALADSEQTKTPGEKKKAGPVYTTGVYLGHLLYVDPEDRYVFILPKDPKEPRRYFYMDRRTLVTLTEEGARNKKPRSLLKEGQRVAVRFIGEDELLIADEIFMIEGEFLQPKAYSRRTRKLRPGEGLRPEDITRNYVASEEELEEKAEKEAASKGGQ